MNYPAASLEVSTGKIRSKGEASFGELNPQWGIKNLREDRSLRVEFDQNSVLFDRWHKAIQHHGLFKVIGGSPQFKPQYWSRK
jgi:hypothetical protein